MARHAAQESHFISRIGWLRAAVLGANDGIVSTASLIAGIAASQADKATVLLTGIAALAAGALSMAAGEYVSVSSQADTERADLARERQELKDFPEAELDELTEIYTARGVKADLARQVAVQLMKADALKAHARDELGISDHLEARPVQAALTSAATFATGAALPLLAVAVAPRAWILTAVFIVTMVSLAGLGLASARSGGAGGLRATLRVTLWGAAALLVTAGIGRLFGTDL